MIAIFLIFFSYICYQMLFKRALMLDAQDAQHSMVNKAHAHHFRGFTHAAQKQPHKESYNNRRPKGFQGGEYIDFEEL